jgi:hypothetical protein
MPAYQNTIHTEEENVDETGPMPDAVHG